MAPVSSAERSRCHPVPPSRPIRPDDCTVRQEAGWRELSGCWMPQSMPVQFKSLRYIDKLRMDSTTKSIPYIIVKIRKHHGRQRIRHTEVASRRSSGWTSTQSLGRCSQVRLTERTWISSPSTPQTLWRMQRIGCGPITRRIRCAVQLSWKATSITDVPLTPLVAEAFHSQMKLQMKRDALEKLKRLANEVALEEGTARVQSPNSDTVLVQLTPKMRRWSSSNVGKYFRMNVAPHVGA